MDKPVSPAKQGWPVLWSYNPHTYVLVYMNKAVTTILTISTWSINCMVKCDHKRVYILTNTFLLSLANTDMVCMLANNLGRADLL